MVCLTIKEILSRLIRYDSKLISFIKQIATVIYLLLICPSHIQLCVQFISYLLIVSKWKMGNGSHWKGSNQRNVIGKQLSANLLNKRTFWNPYLLKIQPVVDSSYFIFLSCNWVSVLYLRICIFGYLLVWLSLHYFKDKYHTFDFIIWYYIIIPTCLGREKYITYR